MDGATANLIRSSFSGRVIQPLDDDDDDDDDDRLRVSGS